MDLPANNDAVPESSSQIGNTRQRGKPGSGRARTAMLSPVAWTCWRERKHGIGHCRHHRDLTGLAFRLDVFVGAPTLPRQGAERGIARRGKSSDRFLADLARGTLPRYRIAFIGSKTQAEFLPARDRDCLARTCARHLEYIVEGAPNMRWGGGMGVAHRRYCHRRAPQPLAGKRTLSGMPRQLGCRFRQLVATPKRADTHRHQRQTDNDSDYPG